MIEENKMKKKEKNLSQFGFERFIVWTFFVMAMVCLIAGRAETFHMTEGEAFIYGWKYWIGTIFFALGAALLSRRTT